VPTCNWIEKQSVEDFKFGSSVTPPCNQCSVLQQFSYGWLQLLSAYDFDGAGCRSAETRSSLIWL